MRESFTAYKKRILGYLGKRDPITVQRTTPARLARLIRGVSRRRLARRPGPTKWSVLEIVAHLADTEIAMAWRLRNMLATPGIRLQWFDQDIWVKKRSYAESDPRRSATLFRALRESNLALLLSVPRRKWNSFYGIHDVRGRQTVLDFVQLEAANDLNHLHQVERMVKRESGRARAH